MSLQHLTMKTRLAMGELLNRARGVASPFDPSIPSRSLDLSELEERILLSVSPAMIAPEMVDTASTTSMTAESARLETGVDAATTSQQPESQSDQLSGSSVSTDPGQTITRELVFLDTRVEDYQSLLDDVRANNDPSREIEVILLSASLDGIDQISAALAGRTDLDAIHIVSHGSDRAVQLGSTWLSSETLSGYVGEIARWGGTLLPAVQTSCFTVASWLPAKTARP